MSVFGVVSILLRLLSTAWLIVLLRRVRDWRIIFLTLTIALMALRQILTLITADPAWNLSLNTSLTELTGLVVSVMGFMTVFFLEGMIADRHRGDNSFQKPLLGTTDTPGNGEERDLDLFDHTPDMLVSIDPGNATIIECNQTFVTRLGYAHKNELVGRNVFDIYASDSKEELDKRIKSFRETGVIQDTLVLLQHKDGSIIEALLNASAVRNEQGQIVRSQSILKDITGHKQTERTLRAIVEGTSSVTGEAFFRSLVKHLATALKIDYAFVNQRIDEQSTLLCTLAFWAHDKIAKNFTYDIVGTPCEKVIDNNKIQFYPTGLKKHFPDNQMLIDIGADSYLGVPLVDSSGQPIGLMGVIHHSPMPGHPETLLAILQIFAARAAAELERLHSEQARSVLHEQLLQAQKMDAVGHLAGGITHDFNNLLMVISVHAQYVKKHLAGSSQIIESIAPIEEAVKQATSVSKSLMMFSQKLHTEKKLIDLNAIVGQTSKMLSRIIPASVNLDLEQPENQHVWVNADQTQIQQIVLNLMINACHAMPHGGQLKISVHVEPGPDGDPQAVLVIRDTGHGMSDEVQSQIFTPFFTTKTTGQNIGLGLSVVKRIVEDHDGQIEVTSQANAGTTFTIRLPNERCSQTNTPAEDLPAQHGAYGNGQNVLLAEDETQVRAILAGELESLGYTVIQAKDGKQLLERFYENKDRIDLLFFDVHLPKRNGLECLRMLRKEGVALPAVVMTGHEDVILEKTDNENATTMLMRKPFDMEQMAAGIHSMLQPS